MTSVGKYRHLSVCSDSRGTMSVLAIDHRSGELGAGAPPKKAEELVAFKKRIVRLLGSAATAVLTDPDYGIHTVIDGELPGNIGYLAPLELTDYNRPLGDRGMDFLPDWDMGKLARMGANGAKLYMLFRPDAPNAAQKTAVVDSIIEQCAKYEIPFFHEPIAYSLDPDKPLSNEERRQIVIANARHFTDRGVDVLKMEFPIDCNVEKDENVWREAAAELDAACTVPWALLSAGVGFDVFVKQAEIACAAGASGVIAGRAIWGDAALLPEAEQEAWLATVGKDRMERLTAICRGLGQSWKTRTPTPKVGVRWYA